MLLDFYFKKLEHKVYLCENINTKKIVVVLKLTIEICVYMC